MNRPTPETDATSYSDGVEMLTVQSDPFALYQKLCEATALIELLERERNEAMDVLSNLSHYLSCGLGDETTTAKEYGARIREGMMCVNNY